MDIGKKIRYFRLLRGLTQKDLGEKIGIEENPRIRIAQYESGRRKPKDNIKQEIARTLDVSPEALDVDIEGDERLAQLFFALEDEYGLKAYEAGDEIVLRVSQNKDKTVFLLKFLKKWAQKNELLENNKIKISQYNNWKYKYSKE